MESCGQHRFAIVQSKTRGCRPIDALIQPLQGWAALWFGPKVGRSRGNLGLDDETPLGL